DRRSPILHAENSPRTAVLHAVLLSPSSPPAYSTDADFRTILAEYPIQRSLCLPPCALQEHLSALLRPYPQLLCSLCLLAPLVDGTPPLHPRSEFRRAIHCRCRCRAASPSQTPARMPNFHSSKASSPTDTPTPTCTPYPDTTTTRHP